MIRARFRLWLPEGLWVEAVSRSFPDASLRLLAAVPAGDGTMELGIQTDSHDRAGEVTAEAPCDAVTREEIIRLSNP